ncbi:PIN domain-containing protein [Bacillus wiedmannii]|uniref:PIN domain-containing protein n=1 Tax=Bacillus wiedmannii TaxID=1890302 RepID=UPI000BF90C9A|nr:tetratricopeptide repeat protein [Bacillus wiedmannii]PFY71162.1 hypothetical protein COL61_16000 [Bacillus wiedmannii]
MIKRFLSKFLPSVPTQIIKTKDNENSSITQIQNINLNVNSEQGQELLRYLSVKYEEGANGTSQEIYVALISKFIDTAKNLLKQARYDEANEHIDELLCSSGYSSIHDVHKAELFYFKGWIALEKENESSCREYIDNILQLDGQNSKAYELEMQLLVYTRNRVEFELLEYKLIQIGINNIDLNLKRALFEVACEDFEKAIEFLTSEGELKQEYKENADALYYLGLCYINTGEFEKAKAALNNSNQLEASQYKKYLEILSEVLPIISIKKMIDFCPLSNEEKKLIERNLSDLLSLQIYMGNTGFDLQIDYWGYILTLKLFIKPEEIIVDVEGLNAEIKNSDMIILMLAEAYYILNRISDALPLYQGLYEKSNNVHILQKIVSILYKQGNCEQIKQYVEKIECIDQDEYLDVINCYLMSCSKNNHSLDELKEVILKYENEFNQEALFYNAVCRAIYPKNEIEGITYLEKAIKNLKNEEELILVSLTCKDIQCYEKGLSLIEDKIESSLILKVIYVEMLLDSNKRDNLIRAEEILSTIPKDEIDDRLLMLKADAKIYTEKYEEAIELFSTVFENTPSEEIAYKTVISKLNLNDGDNIEIYLPFLLKSINPIYIMTGALAQKDLQNNVDEGLKNAYKSLCFLKGKFNETVYQQYISFFIPILGRESRLEGRFDTPIKTVKANTVTTLMSEEGETKHICLHDEDFNTLDENEFDFDCEHILSTSSLGINLLGRNINDLLVYQGKSYKISKIVDKYLYAHFYCFNRHVRERPESKVLRTIQFDFENPQDIFEKMIPFLSEGQQRNKQMLEAYNNGKMPISSIVNFDYSRYYQVVKYLFNSPDQVFNSGFCNTNVLRDNTVPIVINLTSLILLKMVDRLSLIENYSDRIFIPESMISIITSLFEKARNSDKVAGTMYLDDEGVPRYQVLTEEEKRDEINFWRDILITIKECNVIDQIEVAQTLPKELLYDLECISLANSMKGILVCDDFFIREIGHHMFKSVKTTNFISLLELHCKENRDEYEGYLDVLLSLSKNQYVSWGNLGTLHSIIFDYLLNIVPIYGRETPYGKFEEILRELFSDIRFFKENLSGISEIINQLYDKRINPTSLRILELIINQLRTMAEFHGSINSMRQYILAVSKLDISKEQLLLDIYNR